MLVLLLVVRSLSFLHIQTVNYKKIMFRCLLQELTLTTANVREWMGDFHEIRNVAKYATRLSQSIGSLRETVSISRQEVENIPDVEVVGNGIPYYFFDGIGKISAELAREVAMKCGLEKYVPFAFQIRYGAYKGVVVVNPTSLKKLSLRKSMCKYK